MKTIASNVTNEIEIKNSKFITIIYTIDDNSNINSILDNIKTSYPKATHYCYAYRTITTQKSSDDGEPGGTAGIPMLNVLIKEDLVNVLAITVRYFGGIKLGAGGLVRAYTKSLTSALSLVKKEELVEGYLVKISTDYSNQKQLDYLLKDVNIIKKDFNDNIIYTIELAKDNIEILNNYSYEIIDTKLIKNKKQTKS